MISKKDIVTNLKNRIVQMQLGIQITHNGSSDWSLRFSAGKKANVDFLKSLFQIDAKDWNEKFIIAVR